MRLPIAFFVIFFLESDVSCFEFGNFIQLEPDVFRNVSELISSKGYPVEEYTVQTPDGYLLSMQRIPHGKQNSDRSSKPAVFLLPALTYTSSGFVWNNETQSLGYLLADNGYDTWLGNIRGNSLSRRNVRLSPSQVEFWDYSFDEMAKYDLPSMIDFILNKTGQSQLSYIAFGETTLPGFALLSQSPLYNKKIKFYAAMSPITHFTHTGGLLGLGFPLILATQPFYKQIGFVELLPHSHLTEFLDFTICASPLRFICADVLFAIFGYDPNQLNYTRLPVYFNHIPSGTSTKEYIHFAQIHYSKKFQMYDYYGRNTEVYNQATPPEYDVSKITTPIALLTGPKDIIADPRDVAIAQANIKSVVERYIVPYDKFNQGDFVTSIDAYNLVNKKILSLLEQYGRN